MQVRLSADRRSSSRAPRRGLTLAELVVVLAILAVVGGLVLPAVGHYVGDAREGVTRQSLVRIRDVLADVYWSDSFSQLPRPNLNVSPGRQDHPQLRYLFVNRASENVTLSFDPEYRRGWRGPYLVEQPGTLYTIDAAANFTNRYGEAGDPAVWDGWGRPIVIQCPGRLSLSDSRWDVRLVSAGRDGVLSIPPAVATAALVTSDMGDDVWIAVELRP